MSTKAQLSRKFPPGTVVRLLTGSKPTKWDNKVGVIGRWTTTPRPHIVLDNLDYRQGYEVVVCHPQLIEPTGEFDESKILDAGNVCIDTRTVYRETREVATRVIESTRQHIEDECGPECVRLGPVNDRLSPFGGGRCSEFLEAMLRSNPWYSADLDP